MKNIRFLILALLPIVVLGQAKKDVQPTNENYVSLDLFSPFYSHNNTINNTPRWSLGYIKNITEKSKIGLSMGYGNTATSLINTGGDYTLWEVRPEYYHILNPKRKTLKYFALELFYINHKEVFTTQSFFNNQNEFREFDQADYQRHKVGIVPKFGMFINLGNRLGLNVYSGLGLRYRVNNYSNFVTLRARLDDEEHFSPYYRKEGSKIGAEFTIGLKLYYRFKS